MGLGPEPNLIKPWLGTWASQGLQRGWHRIFALNPDSLVSPAFLPLPDAVPSRRRISCSDRHSCPSHNRPPLCSCTDGKGYGNQGKKGWGIDHASLQAMIMPWSCRCIFWLLGGRCTLLDILRMCFLGCWPSLPIAPLSKSTKVWNLSQFLKFGANLKYSLKM